MKHKIRQFHRKLMKKHHGSFYRNDYPFSVMTTPSSRWIRFHLLQGVVITLSHITFDHKVPTNSWYLFYHSQTDERLSCSKSHQETFAYGVMKPLKLILGFKFHFLVHYLKYALVLLCQLYFEIKSVSLAEGLAPCFT